MAKFWKAGVVIALLVGLVAILGLSEAAAQGPLGVTLTGKVLAAKDKGDVQTYFLYVRGKKMRFRVSRIDVADNAPEESASGLEVLEDIGTPRIQVTGTKSAMATLQQPDIVGQRVKITGTLYVADAILTVDSVKKLK